MFYDVYDVSALDSTDVLIDLFRTMNDDLMYVDIHILMLHKLIVCVYYKTGLS